MRLTSCRLLSGFLVLTLAAPAPLLAAGHEPAPVSAGIPGLRASADRAARALAAQPVSTPTPASSPLPRTLPKQGKPSRQVSGGGGSGMMIMSLVSTVAGVAGTYFIYKSLKDQSDAAQAADR